MNVFDTELKGLSKIERANACNSVSIWTLVLIAYLKYMKQKLTKIKGKLDKYAIRVGDFNRRLSRIDRISRWKKSVTMEDLNNTVNILDLILIYFLLL